MRYLFTLIWILIIGDSFSQKLIAEVLYKDSKYGVGDTKMIPLSNGNLFLSRSNITTAKKNKNQIITLFNKEKGKILEFDTESKEDLKGIIFTFIHSDKTNELFGIGYNPKGINGNKSTLSIIKIKSDGTYVVKHDVPTAKNVCAFFFFKNDVVILSLDDNTKRDLEGGSEGRPSGNFHTTTIKSDFSEFLEQQLTIPAFEAEAGHSKYKLMSVDDKYLYFVTEIRLMTNDEKIEVFYRFMKYDFAQNKEVLTKEVPIDFGNNCPRPTNTDLFSENAKLCILDDGYKCDYPNIIYKEKQNAFFVISSYGEGYPNMPIRRNHDGTCILKFDTNFELVYSRFLNATGEMGDDLFFKAATSRHYLYLISVNNKDYFVCYSIGEIRGATTNIYEIDLESGYAKYVKFTKEEYMKALLQMNYKEEYGKATANLKNNNFQSFYSSSDDWHYLLLNDFKQDKFIVYLLTKE